MAFLETPRFPDDIAYGSKGGPQYLTSVPMFASGREKRNVLWAQSRHVFDVGYGIRDQVQLDSLLTFFHAVQGRAHGFRFKDFADFHTGTPGGHGPSGTPVTTPTKDDYSFGTGDDAETVFQLTKAYVKGSLSTGRVISKPINGTILIAIDTVLQTETTHYSIDYSTGLVTFVTPPAAAEDLTWGGQFDVPCRFESDQLTTVLDHYLHGSINVGLVEIRV